jgi:hypothetical protein
MNTEQKLFEDTTISEQVAGMSDLDQKKYAVYKAKHEICWHCKYWRRLDLTDGLCQHRDVTDMTDNNYFKTPPDFGCNKWDEK